jgi:hypothetical protein
VIARTVKSECSPISADITRLIPSTQVCGSLLLQAASACDEVSVWW